MNGGGFRRKKKRAFGSVKVSIGDWYICQKKGNVVCLVYHVHWRKKKRKRRGEFYKFSRDIRFLNSI
jgi:hypothetical protein